MAYTNVDIVQTRIARFIVGSGRTVTPEQLDQIIDDVDAEVNHIVDTLGGTVPVTTPAWFVIRLRSLASDGSAAVVLKSLFPEAQGPGTSPAYAFYEDRYRAGIRLLLVRGLPVALVTRIQAQTYFTRHPEEEAELGTLAGNHMFDVRKVW